MIGYVSAWFNRRAQAQYDRARIPMLEHMLEGSRRDVVTMSEEVKRLQEDNRRLQAEIDRKSAMPGDHRYWEGRYRDEAAENERLKHEISELHRNLLIVTAPKPLQKIAAPCPACEARRIEELNNEKEGPKRDLEKQNDAQAARAMSRNTKQAFQAYQGAVKVILDRLNDLGQKNHVTKEDLRKLRELREDLSNQIQRTI